MTKYEIINARLHDDDIKKAVKAGNYQYIADELKKLYNPKDCGVNGDISEINCGFYLKGYRGNIMVSNKGHVDLTYKGKKHECKTNCGSFLADIAKNDFMIYSYDAQNDCGHPERFHVIPMREFLEGLEACELFRHDKKSSSCGFTMAIQSYKNSKRKLRMWTGFIDKYPTLAEYKARA